MPPTEFDFWLLDLDGTLVDVETSYIHQVFDRLGGELGVPFTRYESEVCWYGIGDARERVLAGKGISPEHFWRTFHRVEDATARAEATHVYPDAEAFVPSLDAPVGLVTHCREYLTRPVLETHDIGDWFDTVVCCTEETGFKPDPRPVEVAMRDMDVARNGHRGVLAGDDPADIGAAWNAGIAGVHVQRRDPDRYGLCVLGDRRVTDLTELAH